MQERQAIPGQEGTDPVLAFVPHQDDELLIMGPAIRNAVRGGRSVHLVLFGLGDGTAVRRRDMPALLGREPSGEEIGRVRDAEFRLSGHLLGVPEDQATMAVSRQPERQFTREACRTAMLHEIARLPDADVWTVSEFDSNPDHAAMGQALGDLAASGDLGAGTATAFVAPWCRGTLPHPPLEAERAQIGYREQRPYRYTDVDAGRWGVGYKSVRSYFTAQLRDPVCYRYDLREAITTGR